MVPRSVSKNIKAELEALELPKTIPEDDHPDFIGGTIVSGRNDGLNEFTPAPDEQIPSTPNPMPIPRLPIPELPMRFPSFCSAVSGRYRYKPFVITRPYPLPTKYPYDRPVVPGNIPGRIIPINFMSIIVRVDVDRFMPQNRISVEVSQLFPRRRAHVIAEVTSDKCRSFNNRRIEAEIVYRDGVESMIPGTKLVFTAARGRGFRYNGYTLEILGGGVSSKKYNLQFESRFFDRVEFEVDRVADSGTIVTTYDTGSHPNRPDDLPDETLSLETVYERAGFDVTMSPNTSVIPTSGAGANTTWSDTEMHNAMVTYWSGFADKPQWALWVLYAAQHDQGYSLGGVMFDDIGDNHRQGTAIFTDSFIQDAPQGDPNAPAWRNRMQFWTAVHEMGHAFNLAHSWQKSLSMPNIPGPWIPLANEPEARSFMNYPYFVAGGESSFFSDFRFRFSDDELVFMRHAPRSFVQMGNSNWFENHGFEAPDILQHTGNWALVLRSNRRSNAYRFLEPVSMELKLTNSSNEVLNLDPDMLMDGAHITVFIQRERGDTKRWRPMVTRCHKSHFEPITPGNSVYGSHLVSASTNGWLIDEPGFYKIQAAVDMGQEIVVSNVLRIYVGTPSSNDEVDIAPEYFIEDVGRSIAFKGTPSLTKAHDVLKQVSARCGDNPAARHAEIALSNPLLRDFKILDASGGREALSITSATAKISAAVKSLKSTLLKDSNSTVETIGHIGYFNMLTDLSSAMKSDGDDKGALDLLSQTVSIMKDRNILSSIIDAAEKSMSDYE